MRKKLIMLIFMLPLIIIGLLYSVSYSAIGNAVDEPDSISFDETASFVLIGETRSLEVSCYPSSEKFKANISYSSDREDILKIDGDQMIGVKSGASQVTARYKNTNITDTINVFVYTKESKELYIIDPGLSYSGISGKTVYGQYDLGPDYSKQNGTISLNAFDFSSSLTIGGHLSPRAKAEKAEVVKGEGELVYNEETKTYQLTVTGPDDITIAFTSSAGDLVDYTVPIIADSYNVYSYAQLLFCTNHSASGLKTVLRNNLESFENSFSDETGQHPKKNTNPLLLTQIEKDSLKGIGTEDFLYLKRTYGGNDYYIEYLKRASTYDVRYLTILDKPTDIYIGLSLKADLHANGFTLNFHALTYPTGAPTVVSGIYLPSLSSDDVFRGPLDYCGVLATDSTEAVASVAGEDNASLAVESSGMKISDLILKSCNNVVSLSQLDFVGTALSIKHQTDVIVENCVIMNGRNLVRAFSNKNLTISHCLLEYAKDYLLRLGCDEYVQLTKEMYADGHDYNYAPADRIGNTVTVDNVFFYNSGFFSIGLENHFNGRYLYDKDEIFTNTLPLGGIAKGTSLCLKGDTRFYDWKDVDSISTDTMLQIRGDLGSLDQYLSNFDIVPIIKRELAKTENQSFSLKVGDKTYLNSAVAFYGGGINNSVLTTDTDLQKLGLNKLGPVAFDPVDDKFLANCAGTEPFNFYMYPASSDITYLSSPKLSDLAA
jgi:hypothetical protein